MINTSLISRLIAVDQVVCAALGEFSGQREALRLCINDLIEQHVNDHSTEIEAKLMARLENDRISNIYSQLKDNKDA